MVWKEDKMRDGKLMFAQLNSIYLSEFELINMILGPTSAASQGATRTYVVISYDPKWKPYALLGS